MTITVNFKQRPSPGYMPRKPVTLHNVDAVTCDGVGRVKVRMLFADPVTTFDHVASVSLQPEQE